MNTLQFLALLKQKGVELSLDGEALCFRGPKGALDPALMAQLRSRKNDLIRVLQNFGKVSNRTSDVIGIAPSDQAKAMSYAQEGLWFMERVNHGGLLYLVPMAFHVIGNASRIFAENAMIHVIMRHRSLRTYFRNRSGKGQPVVDAFKDWRLQVLDLQALPDRSRLQQGRRLVSQFSRIPFDLEEPPLFRCLWVSLAPGEHLFCLCAHHIIFDGWSVGILIDEWSRTYQHLSKGEAPNLTTLKIDYTDYAAWERQTFDDAGLKQQLHWWQEHLQGAKPTLLSGDRPRPNRITYNGANIHSIFPETTLQGAEALAAEQHTAKFTILTAGWLGFLYRLIGQTDLSIGVALSNRNKPEIQGLIGLFVNLMTLRVKVDAVRSFRDMVHETRLVVLESMKRGNVPFEKVVHEVAGSEDAGLHPLFNIQVVMANGLLGQFVPDNLSITPFHWGSGVVARKDLTLLFDESHGSLVLDVEYNSDLYDGSTILRLVRLFAHFLESCLTRPDMLLQSHDLMGPRQVRHLNAWNEVSGQYPREQTVHRLFERQCRKTPNAIALMDSGVTVTYGELNARANRMAWFFYKRGLRPQNCLGLLLQQGTARIAVILASLKLGAIYVPLDPRYPQERLKFMIDDCALMLLVAERALLGVLPDQDDARLLVLESARGQLDAEAADNLSQIKGHPLSAAYIMYTSGSTGQPKGVVVSHRGIIRLVKQAKTLEILPSDVLIQSASVSFDAATFEIWGALLNGARLVLMASHAIDELPQMLRRYQVTVLWLTAQLFHLLVDRHIDALAGLRCLIAGGEALSMAHVQRFLAHHRHVRLVNGYGPTENTTFTACCDLSEIGLSPTSAPIGQPLEYTSVYVLDRNLAQLPIGAMGGLYCGGDGLAQGYHKNPGLTALHFIPDPFATRPGGRLYRTGDLAFVRSMDELDRHLVLEFGGRLDRQIKLRGFRIEPGEVERVLVRLPEIEQAYVYLGEDAKRGAFLGAYLAIGKNQQANSSIIRRLVMAHLTEFLPQFQIPAALNLIAEFPLNSSSKLDVARLPKPQFLDELDEAVGQLPQTPTEELLASIWSQLLGEARICRQQHFFEMGGHSLLANRLMGQVCETFAIDVPLRMVFDLPVLADLADGIDAAMREGSRLVQAPIQPLPRQWDSGPDGMVFQLSFAQERLWFLDRLEPGSAMYSVPVAVRMSGTLFKDTLRACFNEVVRRHETLRTHFKVRDGEPVQVVLPELEIPFSVVDLRDYPMDVRESECMARMTEIAQVPFSLEEGGLLRLVLYRLKHDCHIMLMNMHHIVSDGWSLKILFNEVAHLYGAYAGGQVSSLPPLDIQYADYAVWQRAWFRGDVREAQLEFWRQQLKDAPAALDLPLDYPRPKVQSFRGAGERFFYTKAMTTRFMEACRENAVTPFMMGLAAYALLLSRYCGQQDVCIGSPVANRQHPQVENLIGFFLNTLVFRIHFEPAMTFQDLICLVRRTALDAYAHQELPFEQLVSDLQIERDMSRSPLFQAAFSWDTETTDTEVALPGLLLKHQAIDYRIAKFDLSLGLGYYQGKLFGSFGYNVDLFRSTTMRRMSGHFETILSLLMRDGDGVIQQANILNRDEQQMLLETVNQTDVRFQRFGAHTLFETMVEINGNRLACAVGEDRISYRELNRLANQLAVDLQSRGTGVGHFVAICCAPTVEMVIAQAAVLKSGAAFVPLDPNYPGERLGYMLKDCGAQMLLTQNELLHRVASFEGTVLLLDDAGQQALRAEFSPANLGTPFDPGMAAYMIYTSGSSGQPKGVVVPHAGLTNLVSWHQRAFAITADDRATKLAHVGFDASVWEIWPYLSGGASLHMANPELLRNPAELLRWILASRITIAFLPTPVVELMIHLEWPRHCALRYLLTGGDQLHHFPKDRLPFKLVNNYGPTENAVVTTSCQVLKPLASERMPAIGLPIANVQIYLLDRHMRPCLPGIPGEIYIGGKALAEGYHQKYQLTAAAFVPNPFDGLAGSRLYKTGDLARFLLNEQGQVANIEFLGRMGNQIKLRGFRIELGEVEHHLCAFEGVTDAVVVVAELDNGEKKLVGYVQVPSAEQGQAQGVDINDLREFMAERLPYYMIPSVFVIVERFPMTPNGKVDRRVMASARALSPVMHQDYAPPSGTLEKQLSKIWSDVLGIEKVGTQANFFDLGGHSLLLARVQSKMEEALQLKTDMVELFQYPTIDALVKHLVRQRGNIHDVRSELHQAGLLKRHQFINEEAIAIVGFAGRFPQAADVDALWQLVLEGGDGIIELSVAMLQKMGVPESLIKDPNYVPRAVILDGFDCFDAAFFDVTPSEAARMDPQHRVLLEIAWMALEHAGYDPSSYDGDIGFFGGCGSNGYLYHNLLPHSDGDLGGSLLQGLIGNESAFLSSRISYKLDLTGPSLNVQTACSTSLVAVHLACQSLLVGECDIAMAGGVNIQIPHGVGYRYQEGMPLSKDGRCRPFDANASGTVPGSGAGLVVLKRYSDAIADGDSVYAIIKGAAINNDGQDKSGYTAPSVKGQLKVIREALGVAGCDPQSLGYIETHGTGTPLGDPIEVKALRQAYGNGPGRLAMGSLKATMGHLDAAAGIAGLFKVIQALRHQTIPGQAYFEKLNPALDMGERLYVPKKSQPFPMQESTPRRAAVSSFGIGGTNAHVIVEEFQQKPTSSSSKMPHLVLLSARSEAALGTMTDQLRRHFRKFKPNLTDAAYTLGVGRKRLEYRQYLVCDDLDDAIDGLDDPERLVQSNLDKRPHGIVFVFPGQGSQYIQMGRQLFIDDPEFKNDLDQCADILARLQPVEAGHVLDLRDLIYPNQQAEGPAHERLAETDAAQPAIFAVSWALARWWQRRGLQPTAYIGHSLGEIVAATLAGIFELEDALALIYNRALLMSQLPKGCMVAVPMDADDLKNILGSELSLAAINAPQRCVVSGACDAMAAFVEILDTQNIPYKPIETRLAFHSTVMDAIAERFEHVVRTTPRKMPLVPVISNVHGQLLGEADVHDPSYWVRQLRQTVCFEKGVNYLMARGETCFLEVGPGQALSSCLNRIGQDRQIQVLSSFPREPSPAAEVFHLHESLARLWQLGFSINWSGHYQNCRRIALPTYAFQRAVHWIDPPDKKENMVCQTPTGPTLESLLQALEDMALLKKPVSAMELERLRNKITEHGQASTEQAFKALPDSAKDALSMTIDALKEIWRDVLGVQQIEETSHFMTLGGDSLAASQVLGRIHSQWGSNLRLATLFDMPVLKDLAVHLVDALPSPVVQDSDHLMSKPGAAIKMPPPPPKARGSMKIAIEFDEVEPCLSFAQERLWFFEKLEPGTACYHMPNALSLDGSLDLHALYAALEVIGARHQVLRTVIDECDGIARPRVLNDHVIKPVIVDLSGLENASARPLKDLLRCEAHRPFDPGKALWRCLLIRLRGDRHVLLLHPHHLVFDGWSLKILLQEIAHLYACELLGQDHQLPPLALQYADFAAWQRRRSDDVFWRARLDRCVEKLLGSPPRLELPSDLPSHRLGGLRGRSIREPLADPLVARILKVAEERQMTPYMVLMSCFALLLCRHSRMDEVNIGSPVAARSLPELENLIGCFANTLVFNIPAERFSTFEHLLSHVRQDVLDGVENDDIPFELVVERLNPERSARESPVFQVLFSTENMGSSRGAEVDLLPGLKTAFLDTGLQVTPFYLDLAVLQYSDGMDLRLIYHCDRFESATAQGILRHFKHLLTSCLNDITQPLASLSMVSEPERHSLLEQFQSQWQIIGPFLTCHERFCQQARLTPEAIAVDGVCQISYRHINELANQLAFGLRLRGVVTETVVAVRTDRGYWPVALGLAILKAGGVWLPIDPELPTPLVIKMVVESGVSLVLMHCEDETGLNLEETVLIETFSEEVQACPKTDPMWQVFSEQAAYQIYTSGSSGKAKGVVICHGSMVNHLLAMGAYLALNQNDRVLHFAATGFDLSIEEMMTTLLIGATLVRLDKVAEHGLSLLCEQIDLNQITLLSLPTGLWHEWTHLLATGKLVLPESVRLVVIGTEAASLQAFQCWRQFGGEVRFINAYGTTECTITSAVYEPRHAGVPGPGPLPIGRPLGASRLYVVDRQLRLAGIGVLGELMIGGLGLARGYVHQPGLTAKAFGPDPFSGDPGARLYHSGDLGLVTADGTILFKGRQDRQLKINGYRVEPAAIELQLERLHGIAEALVCMRPKAQGNHVLVAYLASGEEQPPNLDLVREKLITLMPQYMVPQNLVGLTYLPRTHNNKVDLLALPMPCDTTEVDLADGQVETMLCQIWGELLERDAGPSCHFFHSGGHSLLAMRLVAAIHQIFDVALSVRAIFDHPTPRSLSRYLRQWVLKSTGFLKPMHHAAKMAFYPLSLAQERLYFLYRMWPDYSAYLIPVSFRIRGRLSVASFSEALDRVVARHAGLRTKFCEFEGTLGQQILPPNRDYLSVVDLSALGPTDTDDSVIRLGRELVQTPMDLDGGQPFRAVLVCRQAHDFVFYLVVHHIVCDGWSLDVLLRDLHDFYCDGVIGPGQPSAAPIWEYVDYATWQRETFKDRDTHENSALKDGDTHENLAWWCDQLAGAPSEIQLPLIGPRDVMRKRRSQLYRFSFAAEVAVQTLAKTYDVTPFMVCLAAFVAQLSRYARQRRCVIGTPISGRDHHGLENVVGLFINTVPLHFEYEGGRSVSDWLAEVRKQTLQAFTHADVPLEKILQNLKKPRDEARHPLFNVLFAFETRKDGDWHLPGTAIAHQALEPGAPQFDLSLTLVHGGDGIHGAIQFDPDLISSKLVEGLAEHFVAFIQGMVIDGHALVDDVSILSNAKRQNILEAWHCRTVCNHQELCHQFLKVTERFASELAVSHLEQQLSYACLRDQSLILAGRLRERGIGCGDIVAICLPCGVEQIVAIWGILLIGAGYMPIDTQAPPKRAVYQLHDASVRVAITEKAGVALFGLQHIATLSLDYDGKAYLEPSLVVCDQALPAYLIYTSGSTGQAKGVLVSRHSVLHFQMGMDTAIHTQKVRLRIALNAPLHFDASVQQWLRLLNGDLLCIVPEAVRREPAQMLHWLVNHAVDVLDATPSYGQMLLDEGLANCGSSLNMLILGGESIDRTLWRRLQELDGLAVFNVYGPTEACVDVTSCRVAGEDVHMGRPMCGVRAYVLSEQMGLLPVGVPGELYLGGPNLAMGYWGKPSLTATRFVPDPFTRERPGARLYRSSDLVQMDVLEGQQVLQFLRRLGGLVKLNGQRLELGEVQHALMSLEGVVRAYVGLRGEGERQHLCAYLQTVHETWAFNETVLRHQLADFLPEYMMPAVFVPVQTWPLLPSGKVDVQTLLSQDIAIADPSNNPVMTQTERLVLEIWQELLEKDDLRLEDNLLAFGAHSLLVIRAVARLNEAFGVLIPLVSFFRFMNIREQAAYVEVLEWLHLLGEMDPHIAEGQEVWEI